MVRIRKITGVQSAQLRRPASTDTLTLYASTMNPDLEPEPVRESAPYGKACIGCSRAKCKCILRERSASCERCHRLNKTCEPSPVVRKRVAQRSKSGRTKNLEDKLDSLVTLLAKQAEEKAGNVGDNHRYSDTGSTPGSSRARDDIPLRPVPPPDSYTAAPMSSSYQSSSHPTPPSTDASSPVNLEPSPLQAEEYLQMFREQHLKFFPFVYIPIDKRFANSIAKTNDSKLTFFS